MPESIEQYIRVLIQKEIANIQLDHSRQAPRQKLVIANWKMNLSVNSALEYIQLLNANSAVKTVLCAPSSFLYPMNVVIQQLAKSVKLGAQNLHWESKGAYTGELSAGMLKEVGCAYVIVGHSERRMSGETDTIISKKVRKAIDSELIPILCVGETGIEREREITMDVIAAQLQAALEQVVDLSQLAVAYEPVWAIGTGKTATPEEAQNVIAGIRSVLWQAYGEQADQVPILYGGSVNCDNAAHFSRMKDIDGALVGGASLSVIDFEAIVQSFGLKGIAFGKKESCNDEKSSNRQ